ncbi:MAG: hypothetical protein ACOC78_03950, partial [Actinomycetota bacterium]
GAGTNVYAIKAGPDMVGKARRELASELEEKYECYLLAVMDEKSLKPRGAEYRIAEGDNILVISGKEPPEAASET